MERVVGSARGAATVSREKFKKGAHCIPFIFIWVEIRTVMLRAGLTLPASMHFIVMRVIFLLLPAVREFASIFVSTSVSIRLNKILSFPLRALLPLIFKGMRFSSEVLPVVSIYARVSCVWGVTVRAPYSFKMEHVEIWWVIFRLVISGVDWCLLRTFFFFLKRWGKFMK